MLVLTAVPAGLRGHVTRWLLEIAPGVFVGTPSVRVRDLLWQTVLSHQNTGRALMVYRVRSEQRLEFRVAGHEWEPIDFDGLQLIRRPHPGGEPSQPARRPGWSNASRRRRRN